MIRKNKFTIVSLSAVIFFVIVFKINQYMSTPYTADYNEQKADIIIPKGASVHQIADTLYGKRLIDSKRMFVFWARVLGEDDKLKAGYFSVPKHLSYPQLLSFFRKAKTRELKVTLIEGWDNERVAEALRRTFHIDKNRFLSLTRDSVFIHLLGIKSDNLLGYLLPDTYRFYWGVTEERLIKTLVGYTLEIFKADSVKRAMDKLDMSVHQILTMASIIEGEAVYDDERPIIASVYYNRLRRHIKLQADPTIQFIIDGPPRRLLLKDLKIDSPYNTYLHYGLPPGPINNPGKSSIMAALFPAKTKYIFFAAKGDGRHKFSVTSKEHAKAHSELNRLRRIERQKKRAKKDSNL